MCVVLGGGGGDITPPVISNCPSGVEVSAPAGASSSVAVWPIIGATDNSGVTPTRTATHESGDLFAPGTTTVTVTFTDGAGNSASCIFDVVVTGKMCIFLIDFC